MPYNQISTSGTIIPGPDPAGPQPQKIRQIIESSLNDNGFTFVWSDKTHQPYHGTLDTGSGTTIDLYIYAWRIINGGRKTLPSEKRIEIHTYVDNVGFNRPITSTEKTLLLGIYDSPSGTPIFAAWDASANANRGKQKSCQISVENLQAALSNKIFQCTDTHNNTIFTFLPECFGDYIDLVKSGNILDIPATTATTATTDLVNQIQNATLPHKKNRTIKSTDKILSQIASLSETEKEMLTKQRIGQGLFKDLLKNKYHGKCALCSISTENMLIASHIKPWKDCTDSEKLDENNGLLLCAHHDALFDKHLISFDATGSLIVSPILSTTERAELNISAIPLIDVTPEMTSYLADHSGKLKK